MRSDATPLRVGDLPAVWAETRERVLDLLAASSPDALGQKVPTQPQMTVADLSDLLRSALRADEAGVGDAEWRERISDLAMREHDLRTALDRPGHRDSRAVMVALDALAGDFSDRVEREGLPPLRVSVEQWGTVAGSGPALGCVVADRFEFVRAMAARRSAAQVARWNWGIDPVPYVAVMAAVALPEDDVLERDPRIPAHMRDREFLL